MKFNIYHKILFILLLSVNSVACNEQEAKQQEPTEVSDGLIRITKQQFETNQMKIGTAITYNFANIVECNGYISATPNGMATVSTQIGGIVRNINVSMGDFVKKGSLLCELTSNDFISLQKDFAEISAKLKQLEADYKRSKSLYEEKISSQKDFLNIESQYFAAQALYKALKIQLQLLDLDVTKIEQSDFYRALPIRAPISGNISELNINLGQYVEQQKQLMEIVNEHSLQLKISVFEEDISKLKQGQPVQFYSVNNRGEVFDAHITTIGKTVNTSSKTIICIASIDDKGVSTFVNNSFIKVTIKVDEQKAYAVPNAAIVKLANQYAVLSLINNEEGVYYFKKIAIQIGQQTKEYTEIKASPKLGKILIEGAYNLQVE